MLRLADGALERVDRPLPEGIERHDIGRRPERAAIDPAPRLGECLETVRRLVAEQEPACGRSPSSSSCSQSPTTWNSRSLSTPSAGVSSIDASTSDDGVLRSSSPYSAHRSARSAPSDSRAA